MVLYNYYREDWLIRKIGTMLHHTFGEWPAVKTFEGWGGAAVFLIGPKMHQLQKKSLLQNTLTHPIPYNGPTATDDWPFLYLKNREISAIYLKSLLLVGLLAIALAHLVSPKKSFTSVNLHFFFLGTAFMLLEVKSIITFGLLFGSTWMVNSLVFFAILLIVLLAIYLNMKVKLQKKSIFYSLLFLSLWTGYLIPMNVFLGETAWVRYVTASLVVLSPLFFANVIFSDSFRDSQEWEIAFGSNLLGAFFGGVLEYCSLIFGYRDLILFVMLFYALALLTRKGLKFSF